MTSPQPDQSHHFQGWPQDQIWQQQTAHNPAIPIAPDQNDPNSFFLPEETTTPSPPEAKKRTRFRIVAIAIALVLALALYLVWHTAPSTASPPVTTQQSFNSTSTPKSSNGGTSTSTSGSIQVYIVGAVKHPGVFTLPTDARVYQLLQVAGGPLPKANLVALNLAARLTDGQEVYVTAIGETPPTYVGGVPEPGTGTGGSGTGQTSSLININTASAYQVTSLAYLHMRKRIALLRFASFLHLLLSMVPQRSHLIQMLPSRAGKSY